jgi:hypothetical protein
MVFTFSTKTKKPEDTRLVQELKDRCEETGQNFSALVVKLLKEYAEDERST